ncbi:hypothetical protein JZ751_029506 [Albula glossodonta]|uniref:Uncharacterized protein n=1 Tax=Albula glossodonta TaxID=121402 RepID=A0A8T2PHT8_9TELE|nr:hypothetical protein JZ751_029506 [Albula glossodonta]
MDSQGIWETSEPTTMSAPEQEISHSTHPTEHSNAPVQPTPKEEQFTTPRGASNEHMETAENPGENPNPLPGNLEVPSQMSSSNPFRTSDW